MKYRGKLSFFMTATVSFFARKSLEMNTICAP